jgi:hypothetical protein
MTGTTVHGPRYCSCLTASDCPGPFGVDLRRSVGAVLPIRSWGTVVAARVTVFCPGGANGHDITARLTHPVMLLTAAGIDVVWEVTLLFVNNDAPGAVVLWRDVREHHNLTPPCSIFLAILVTTPRPRLQQWGSNHRFRPGLNPDIIPFMWDKTLYPGFCPSAESASVSQFSKSLVTGLRVFL